jgi:hypothetical protein
MKNGFWLVVVMAAALLGFGAGYSISSKTGVIPGYFEAVEAAGYGGGEELVEGLSEELQEFYQELHEECPHCPPE